MRYFLVFVVMIFAATTLQADVFSQWADRYEELLQKYVKASKLKGIPSNLVNYQGLRQDARFYELSKELADWPSFEKLAKERRLAVWINLYNFLTLEKVVRNPGLKKLTDLNKNGVDVWDQPAGKVAGKTYTLNEIEHQIIRKRFNEPRIHVALVCAALSCPDLLQQAYRGSRLKEQLDLQMRKFLRNSKKGMRVEEGFWSDTVYLSKVFDWFKEDFKKRPLNWLARRGYLKEDLADSELKFLPYDWTLNALPGKN